MSQCTLCQVRVTKDEEFCCHGCAAVYQILSSKGALEHFESDPLFQQALKGGLISNPELLKRMQKKSESKDLLRETFEIQDLWCPSCAEVINLLLIQEKGINQVAVDYATDLATVEYDPKVLGKEDIHKLITKIGYHPKSLDDEESLVKDDKLTLRFSIAAFCAANAMMMAYPLYSGAEKGIFGWLSFAFAVPSFIVAAPIFRRFWRSLTVGILGMEALVSIAIAAAFTLSTWQLIQGSSAIYFDSMTVLIALILLGKILERKAKHSAKLSHQMLMRALPRRGRRESGEFVPLKEIVKGDVLLAYQGEKVVLDGRIIEGSAALDESLITGEALPVSKSKGLKVYSGSIVNSGWVKYSVLASLEASSLKMMIDLIEGDLKRKEKGSNLVDRISAILIPLLIVIATVSLYFNGMKGFLSVLLIACPCTLGIALPLVESRLIHTLSSMGLIVRNRNALSSLAKVSRWVFDKTGTVTEGRLTVDALSNELTDVQAATLKALALRSTHPASKAVAEYVEGEPALIEDVTEIAGFGVKAGHWRLGSERFMQDLGLKLNSESILTTLLFVFDGEVLTEITLKDQLKEQLPENPWQLLSGDKESVVKAVAKSAGASFYDAEKTPLEKRDVIEVLKEKDVVCFVGDGINDSLALATADVGVAVSGGTDISEYSSDIQMVTSNLKILKKAQLLAKRAKRLSRQNLFWAFSYNIVGVGLAAFGLLEPIYGAFAMVASSLIVIINSNRV